MLVTRSPALMLSIRSTKRVLTPVRCCLTSTDHQLLSTRRTQSPHSTLALGLLSIPDDEPPRWFPVQISFQEFQTVPKAPASVCSRSNCS